MNRIKLFSYIIISEIIVIGILLIVLFLSSNRSNDQGRIVIPNDIIYTKNTSIPYTGKMLDTLDNNLIVNFNVVDGLKQGEFYLLTMDGKYAVQGYMNKNKNDGNWKYFYENGKLECTGNFIDDEPTGKWVWFYKNGLKKCEGNFVNNKPNGKWIKYDEEGNVSLIVYYRVGDVISLIELAKPVRS
jgi:antitoxin component YwqK of YwqJK toxin-antitoxin module